MMSDLISRKARLEEISILMNGAEQHQTGEYKEGYIGALVALKMLTEQADTAYDPDKVVKQLEKEHQEAKIEYNRECHSYYEGKMIAFDNAIEIVKKGGVE